MSYYIRYILTEDRGVTLPELEQALLSVDSGYEIDGDLVVLNDEEIGQIEINEKEGDLFKSDLELLRRWAKQKRNQDTLQAELNRARSLVIVQPIWSLGDDETLEALEPLFDWLLANRSGILAEEDGSFYNRSGPID